MPWSNQGGSGGGGWKGGSGGGGPWGQPPSGGGGGGGPHQPDLQEILKRSQDRLKQTMPGGGPSKALIALMLLVALPVIAFLFFTVRVNPDEQGLVLRFGAYDRVLTPGLHLRMPYPLEEVYLPKVTRVNETQIGFQQVSDSRFSGGQIRDVSEESLMLTGDENIVDVDFVVFWLINDARKFLFNIQSPEVTVKEVAESAMREIIGENGLEAILTQERGKNETAVLELMQRTLDGYDSGVQITQVQMKQVDPPSEVVGAFRDVQAAQADQVRLQNEARSYANRIVPEARGEAERIIQAAQGYRDRSIAEATGQADRFLKIYEEYRKAPEVTRQRMFLETMERVFGEMDKVIIDNSNGGTGVVPYLPLNEINRNQAGRQ